MQRYPELATVVSAAALVLQKAGSSGLDHLRNVPHCSAVLRRTRLQDLDATRLTAQPCRVPACLNITMTSGLQRLPDVGSRDAVGDWRCWRLDLDQSPTTFTPATCILAAASASPVTSIPRKYLYKTPRSRGHEAFLKQYNNAADY